MTRSVLIVEDHPATALGLEAVLSADQTLDIAGWAKQAEEALKALRVKPVDVLCADLGLPGEMNGLELCGLCHEEYPEIALILFTAQEEADLVPRAREAGVLGVVAKRDVSGELSKAITLALEQQAYASPRFARTIELPELTPRQRDVLGLLAQGLDNKAISKQLGVGPETVKSHVSKLLDLLAANDRTHAVAIGLRNALIS